MPSSSKTSLMTFELSTDVYSILVTRGFSLPYFLLAYKSSTMNRHNIKRLVTLAQLQCV